MNKKICTSCKKPKEHSEFGKNRGNPDGLQYWCRVCFASYHADHATGIRRTPPRPPPGLKKCTRCQTLKSVSEFSKGAREADGLQDNCRPCNKKVSAEYRAANTEKERERHATYHAANKAQIAVKTRTWAKANPEKGRARNRRFYTNNREKELARMAKWNAANREYLRLKVQQWRAANVERRRAYEREYLKSHRAAVNAKTTRRKTRLMQALAPWANHVKIAGFYAEAQRLTVSTGIEHHVDHIVPLVHGLVSGLHSEHNLQVITGIENSKKNNRFIV